MVEVAPAPPGFERAIASAPAATPAALDSSPSLEGAAATEFEPRNRLTGKVRLLAPKNADRRALLALAPEPIMRRCGLGSSPHAAPTACKRRPSCLGFPSSGGQARRACRSPKCSPELTTRPADPTASLPHTSPSK
jgi:hypothetical protein